MTVGIPSTFTPLISRQSLQHLATVFAPSTLSKDVLNKLTVSSLTKVEIKSTNCVDITLPSPLGTVSDLTSVDQLSCRNLTLEPNSNNAADVFFGQFPYLEELVISDHCCRRASTLVLDASSAHLRSIRIGADCYSQLPEGASGTVTLKALPVLESVVVGKRCFGGFSRLCVEGCPELTTVTIGELCECETGLLREAEKGYSFEKAAECVIQSPAGGLSSRLDNEALQTLRVGHACFLAPVTVRLEALPVLRTVECGALSFCHCELLRMANAPALETLVLHPFAFFYCKEAVVNSERGEMR